VVLAEDLQLDLLAAVRRRLEDLVEEARELARVHEARQAIDAGGGLVVVLLSIRLPVELAVGHLVIGRLDARKLVLPRMGRHVREVNAEWGVWGRHAARSAVSRSP
jgi:hypothetical protein